MTNFLNLHYIFNFTQLKGFFYKFEKLSNISYLTAIISQKSTNMFHEKVLKLGWLFSIKQRNNPYSYLSYTRDSTRHSILPLFFSSNAIGMNYTSNSFLIVYDMGNGAYWRHYEFVD